MAKLAGVEMPTVRYAHSGDVSVAYRSVGEGPRDIVVVPGYVSHLDLMGENPLISHVFGRLLSFARVTAFDKRGTGMSDPVEGAPTLEERMDDLRAVMDAVGIEHTNLMGNSEGAPMSILFAATHPERVDALVLVGGMARSTWAPDYPWARPKQALLESLQEFTVPRWGEGDSIDYFAPTTVGDPAQRAWWAKIERQGASPSMIRKLSQMFFEVDVRDALPLVQAPTLVLHRSGDRVVSSGASKWMAEQIKGARFVELPGPDHIGWAGDADALMDEVLVSSTVKDLVAGSGIQFEERGTHVLKGVPGEWSLHTVSGDRPS